ncbi:amidohydrolase [Mycoplasmatota bacterium]|nr:amidohydrolase [Mycoplasmatota bacterium]
MNLLEEVKKYEQKIINHRRYLHENAEVHNDLPITTKYVMDQLKGMGYDPKEITKSGVVALAGGKKPGKTFMLRGDMDALPLKEQVNLPYKSKTDNMHACGHDLHTAMLLGAAQLLKDNEDQIEGTVKMMFQPAEETLSGAKDMIDAGLLENPTVDAAMMIHAFAGVNVPTGAIIYMTNGLASASSDWFDIEIQGKGGHGATPHSAIDPLVAMSHIHLAIGELNSREIDPDKFLVATVCKIRGGTTGNIVPDSSIMTGTIRTFDNEIREYSKRRIQEIADGIARSLRCKARVRFYSGCPSVINNKEVNDAVTKYSSNLFGETALCNASKLFGENARMSGSEDFAFISEKVPSAFIGIAATLKIDDQVYPHHHPKVAFDEGALSVGAVVYANTAIEWLKEHK